MDELTINNKVHGAKLTTNTTLLINPHYSTYIQAATFCVFYDLQNWWLSTIWKKQYSVRTPFAGGVSNQLIKKGCKIIQHARRFEQLRGTVVVEIIDNKLSVNIDKLYMMIPITVRFDLESLIVPKKTVRLFITCWF